MAAGVGATAGLGLAVGLAVEIDYDQQREGIILPRFRPAAG